ncbi:rhodanese-like domain-containing protein [Pontiellaceae bacterium B12227]|nr:rhodanese-like domain-containing protein [Pontiellaceae bacterium B12227]
MGTTLKRIGIILLVSGMLALVANLVHPRRIPWVQSWSNHVEAKARKAEIRVIPFSVALQKFQTSEVVFMDARPAGEFEAGHISGAVSMPFQSLEEQFPMIGNLINSGKELVVYCSNRECDDSLVLATELKAMGAENLTLYIDGFEVWQKYGGATASSPAGP